MARPCSTGNMRQLGVHTQLVRQHRHDLLLRALLDQGVEQHDALVLEEAVHVGVAVVAALAAVDDVQLAQGEAQGPCQALDSLPATAAPQHMLATLTCNTFAGTAGDAA